MLLYPTYFTHKVTDLNINFLNQINVKGIILDVDDTLVESNESVPQSDIVNWIETLKSSGIKVILLSNNISIRVEPLAKKLDILYISMAMKPLTAGLKKAIKRISCNPQSVIIVGDQIFTDILAANIFKIRSVLVDPLEKSSTFLLKLKRFIEKPIKSNIILNPELKLENIKKELSNISSEDKNS